MAGPIALASPNYDPFPLLLLYIFLSTPSPTLLSTARDHNVSLRFLYTNKTKCIKTASFFTSEEKGRGRDLKVSESVNLGGKISGKDFF